MGRFRLSYLLSFKLYSVFSWYLFDLFLWLLILALTPFLQLLLDLYPSPSTEVSFCFLSRQISCFKNVWDYFQNQKLFFFFIRERFFMESINVYLTAAFDMVHDSAVALETLISLGFERVLTSGCDISALEGLPVIKRLIDQVSVKSSIFIKTCLHSYKTKIT